MTRASTYERTHRSAPRLVKAGAQLSLAEQIAAFKRIEREQAQLRAAITARGRKAAEADGRKMLPRFEDICREFGD
ncbi:hypothetical protein CMI47_05700 [Candidatus Pacearchaeota archaeon]|jgi:hypothetical protein|nr:hypothetical protein [Candidatus Pacearchaeota archaeon]|tara:strand:- start:21 stop:248 length:228 start_codon:yes stop_codon:yes gene_type:complete